MESLIPNFPIGQKELKMSESDWVTLKLSKDVRAVSEERRQHDEKWSLHDYPFSKLI